MHPVHTGLDPTCTFCLIDTRAFTCSSACRLENRFPVAKLFYFSQKVSFCTFFGKKSYKHSVYYIKSSYFCSVKRQNLMFNLIIIIMKKSRLSVSSVELIYILEGLDCYEDAAVKLLHSGFSHVNKDELKGRLLEQRKFRCRCFDFLKKHYGFGLE